VYRPPAPKCSTPGQAASSEAFLISLDVSMLLYDTPIYCLLCLVTCTTCRRHARSCLLRITRRKTCCWASNSLDTRQQLQLCTNLGVAAPCQWLHSLGYCSVHQTASRLTAGTPRANRICLLAAKQVVCSHTLMLCSASPSALVFHCQSMLLLWNSQVRTAAAWKTRNLALKLN
jgi:hypothetical protein